MLIAFVLLFILFYFLFSLWCKVGLLQPYVPQHLSSFLCELPSCVWYPEPKFSLTWSCYLWVNKVWLRCNWFIPHITILVWVGPLACFSSALSHFVSSALSRLVQPCECDSAPAISSLTSSLSAMQLYKRWKTEQSGQLIRPLRTLLIPRDS